MSKKSVFCITTSREQADRIVEQLKTANFSNNDISVLFPDKRSGRDIAHEKNTKAPEGAATGAGIGGAPMLSVWAGCANGSMNWTRASPRRCIATAAIVVGSWIIAELSGWTKHTVETWGDFGEVLLPDLLHVPRRAFAIGLVVALVTIILLLERFTIR